MQSKPSLSREFRLGQRFTFLEILEDKELFWLFLLGSSQKYYKGGIPKIEGEDLEDVQKKQTSAASDRRAKLLRKLKGVSTAPKPEQEYKPELDDTKLSIEMANLKNRLKVNIDFWNKNGYDVNGVVKIDSYALEFKKSIANLEETIIYNTESQLLYSTVKQNDKTFEKLLGSREIILMAKLLEILDKETVEFLENR